MEQQGLDILLEDVNRARQEIIKMSTALDHETRAHHWTNFLEHHNRFFNHFGNLVKSMSGAAKGWWGTVINERSKDELLRYLHHARNADGHGTKKIAVPIPAPNAFVMVMIENKIMSGIAGTKESTALVPVVDCKVTYYPPKNHLGKMLKLHKPSPATLLAIEVGLAEPVKGMSYIANIANDYCKNLIEKAKKYD